jgi:hypothetical protein
VVVERLREARNTCEAIHTKRFMRSGSYETVHMKRSQHVTTPAKRLMIVNEECSWVAVRL